MKNTKEIKSAPLYLVLSKLSGSRIGIRIFSLKRAAKTADGLNWTYPSTGGNKKVPVNSVGNIDTSDAGSYKAYITIKSGVQELAHAVLSKHEKDVRKSQAPAAKVKSTPVAKAPVVKESIPVAAKPAAEVITSPTGRVFTGKDLEDVKSVEAMLAGNKNAFTVIYKRYYAIIRQKYMIALKYNQDIVDDLTQDLFVKVSENISKYSTQYTFNSWISRVAKNHMVDYIRKGKLDTVSYDNTFDSGSGEKEFGNVLQPVDNNTLSGEEEMIETERKAAVEYMLLTLDIRTASIVKKRYFEGLSYDEIAKEEGMALSDVKISLFRAKAKLNKLIINNPGLMSVCVNN